MGVGVNPGCVLENVKCRKLILGRHSLGAVGLQHHDQHHNLDLTFDLIVVTCDHEF